MILATHAVVAVAITHRLPDIGSVIGVAFASHYLFDMIPHWHYSVPRIKAAVEKLAPEKTLSFKRIFLLDSAKIVFDFAVGMTASFMIFDAPALTILIAGFVACLPDFMVGLSRFWPAKPLMWHYYIHKWIHAKRRLDDQAFFGISSQLAIVAICVFTFLSPF